MSSLREQILARFKTVAQGIAGVVDVTRERQVGLPREKTPAVDIAYGGAKSVVRRAVGVDAHEIAVHVGIVVRGDPWTTAADAVDAPLHQALMADATLAGLCQLFREADQAEAQEADLTAGVLTVPYRCVFLARAGDITLAP
jgi:hypothetical protein